MVPFLKGFTLSIKERDLGYTWLAFGKLDHLRKIEIQKARPGVGFPLGPQAFHLNPPMTA